MGTAAQRNALDGANIKRVIQVTPTGSPAGSAGDADAVVAADQTAVGVKGFNGTTWDRLRSGAADLGVGTGVLNVVPLVYHSGSAINLLRSAGATSDASDGSQYSPSGAMGFNGTTWDRLRIASASAAGAGGVGVLAAVPHFWDSVAATYQPAKAVRSFSDGDVGANSTPAPAIVFNGATFERLRTANVFKPFSVTVASLGIAPQIIWTQASGNKKFRFMGASVTSDKAAVVNFREASVATFLNTPKLLANTPFTFPAIGNGYLASAASNQVGIDVDSGVPVVLTGFAFGTEE